MPDTPQVARRRHNEDLKKAVLAECQQPGASVARIALSHGLNANLVHKWRRQAQPQACVAVPEPTTTFIPLAMAPAGPVGEVRIELRRGPLAVTVNWPLSAMPECSHWLRELLR